jgi:hypothetical protein
MWGAMGAEVKDSVNDGKDGTPLGVTGTALANQFALNPFFW